MSKCIGEFVVKGTQGDVQAADGEPAEEERAPAAEIARCGDGGPGSRRTAGVAFDLSPQFTTAGADECVAHGPLVPAPSHLDERGRAGAEALAPHVVVLRGHGWLFNLGCGLRTGRSGGDLGDGAEAFEGGVLLAEGP